MKRRMHGRSLLFVGASLIIVSVAGAAPPAKPTPSLLYERDILPLLQSRCLGCHGETQPRAGLDLRTLGSVLQGGHSGPAVIAGNPERSPLYTLVHSGKMPPGPEKLSPAHQQRLATWIRQGAAGATREVGHWAFRPPVRPPIPSNIRVFRYSGIQVFRYSGVQDDLTPTPDTRHPNPAPHSVRAVNDPSGRRSANRPADGKAWQDSPPSLVRNERPGKGAGGLGKSLNPIDAFLLAELRKKGLTFAPEADRRTLIRRVTYDLIGLPPTPQEVEAFVQDTSPYAYEKLVDRLLADPRYGERWARYWLDTAGYADSEGVLQEDRIRPNAWRYRDYVIRSLNADKPYHRFLQEQIAGDERVDYRHAPRWTPTIEEAITATGFLRTAVDATRDDFNEHQFTEYQYRMLNDTQTILVSTTLGLTLHCARCHNHKYEPLTQKDYYRMQAILEGAIRPKGKLLPTSRRQIVAGTLAEQQQAQETNQKVEAAVQALRGKQAALLQEFRLRALEKANLSEADRKSLQAALRTEEAKRTPEQKNLLMQYKAQVETPPETLAMAYPAFKRQQEELQQALQAEEQRRITLPEIRALYDQDATPPPTPILIRGEWTRPGEAVEPGIPAVLDDPRQPFQVASPAKEAVTTGRRLALAEWMTRPNNPLTARVLVNRIWAHHFGVGIVPTLDNFGKSGATPTHPALLDWLATTFVEGDGWSIKTLHRRIVRSAAYRQRSSFRPDAAQKDPANRLLWRQRVRRLEAEAVRDGMLAVSGTLEPQMYGEPVAEDVRGTGEIVPVNEEKTGRRSLYLLVRRSLPVTLLNVFDAPVMETNCTRRVVSTTATQALTLLNSSFLAAQAQHFAQRLRKEPTLRTANQTATIAYAYRLAFGRPPTPTEAQATTTFLQAQTALYSKLGKSSEEATEQAYADFCQALLCANEFVYLD